jgi:NAD(P)-dependent dehydrogenase (short-subunit alcohol dehydrogenase family)
MDGSLTNEVACYLMRPSFAKRALMPTVLITGANRGIGLELATQYAAAGWRVFAACRDPATAEVAALTRTRSQVVALALEVTNGESIAAAQRTTAGVAIDVLLNNAGVFGPKREAENDPGQSFGSVRYADFEEVMRVNALGPLRIAEAFVDQVVASEQRKIVTISSGLGSIAQTTGGYLAYRASKAAANMLMASLAAELRPRGVQTLALCPGWVRTRMGGASAPVTPAASANGIRARIDELNTSNSGRFLLYDGTPVPW